MIMMFLKTFQLWKPMYEKTFETQHIDSDKKTRNFYICEMQLPLNKSVFSFLHQLTT